MRRIRTLVFVPLLLLSLSCGHSPAPSPMKSVATLEDVMHGMVIPSADVVWKSVGSVSTLEGVEERAPKTEDDWFKVESAAIMLTEAGNLLMMEGRAKDQGKWIEWSRALRESGAKVLEAAKKKDAAGVFETGGVLFESCQGCHFAYRFQKDPNTIRTH